MIETCGAQVHGTANAYKHHRCRCETARRAASRAAKEWNLRRLRGETTVDSTGTCRRIRALAAIGYSYRDQAAWLDVLPTAVAEYVTHRRVWASTAARVRSMYDALSMTPGPNGRARVLARNRGWPPPLAWDDGEIDDPGAKPVTGEAGDDLDEVVIERLMTGAPVSRYSRAERREAVRRLREAGHSTRDIAGRLGVHERQVHRDLAALGLTQGRAA